MMGAMPVVVVEERSEAGGAVVGVGVGVGVSPLAERGLDEAFGLAIGLGSVGPGEALLESESADGGAHGAGAVAGAVVGVDALGVDAMLFKEGESGVEEGDGAGGGFIREELSEGHAGMVVDGDVEELPACARGVIALAVAGDAMARAHNARELLDVKMDKITWMLAFITAHRRWRLQGGEAGAMEAQEA